MKLTLIIPVFIGLISCATKEVKMVEQETYRRNSFHKSYPLELIIAEGKDKTTFTYKEKSELDSSYTYLVETFKSDTSKITFWGLECPLIDKKTFKVVDKEYEVLKYRYDEPDGLDEEIDIYFTNEYGMIGFKELAWSGYSMFDNVERKLIEELKADSTIFFQLNYQFKYM